MKVNTAYQAKNRLGEGPLWSVKEQCIYWVDILQCSIHALNPGNGEHRRWKMPEHIGSFAFREKGGAVVALRNGLFFYDFDTEQLELIADPEAGPGKTRFNDGKCDRRGRFWTGTMAYSESDPIAALYRLDEKGEIKKMESDVTISNGTGWSPDNRTMYYTDSPTQCIYAYDFDLETGNITNRRVFAKDKLGYPDGLTVDSEGFVWSAKWDAWRIVRYKPDGSVDRIVKLPVQCPTSCTFGGPELKHLYITSAWKGLSEEEREHQPEAGNLLVIKTRVAGLPEPLYAG